MTELSEFHGQEIKVKVHRSELVNWYRSSCLQVRNVSQFDTGLGDLVIKLLTTLLQASLRSFFHHLNGKKF
jgi:hypothetical protein